MWRHRAAVLQPVLSLTEDQHAQIKRLALEGQIDWSTKDGDFAALVANFRAEVKEHYYRHQRRRCCYCSTELLPHKLTYDAEHILDKDGYPEYMFDESNLSVACKLCNQHKSNKSISSDGARLTELSKNSNHYSIVHPHLDEWSDHLKFDSVGRILSNYSQKGLETIKICGIAALNAVRLADEFNIEDTHEAEAALRTFHEVGDPVRKQKLLELLGEMAQRYDHPGSRAVIEALTMDLSQLPLGSGTEAALAREQDAIVGIEYSALAADSHAMLERPVVVEMPVLMLPSQIGTAAGQLAQVPKAAGDAADDYDEQKP